MNTVIARNALITAANPTAPDWIELIPAGPLVVGVDGRQWRNDTPDRIVATANSARNPLVVDYEHASEHRAPHGLDAPAAGWIDRLEVRGAGSIWGHVEWTAKALQYIAEKAYRFISPVFTFEKDTARIVALVSAGLTNQPNLPLTALNRSFATMPALSTTAQKFVIPVALNADDQRLITELQHGNNITLKEAYERMIQLKAGVQAAVQRRGETFNGSYKKALTEIERRYWPTV